MPFPPNPLINGNYVDFSSIDLGFSHMPGVLDFKGFSELNYGDGMDPGIVRGAQPQPLGITPGQYAAEGDLTLVKAYHEEFFRALGAAGGSIYGTFFHVTVTFELQLATTGIVTERLIGCRLKKTDANQTQGNDALMRKYSIFISRIDWIPGVPTIPGQLL